MKIPPHLGGHANRTHVDTGLFKVFQGIDSLLDIGCGPGGQVEAAMKRGIRAIGVDGDWTLASSLARPIVTHDFTTGPLDLKLIESYLPLDVAWSVEFLEHVEEQFIPNFMPLFQLARHSVVTAAPPGKVGHHHVNCQPQSYWIEVFDRYDLEYDLSLSLQMKASSRMTQAFMRAHGMVFKNRREL